MLLKEDVKKVEINSLFQDKMIPSKNKLSSVEVKSVFNSPDKVFYSNLFKVLFLSSSSSKKFAVVVPNHITKKAVERNVVRRKFFSVLSEMYKDTKTGFYVIIIQKSFLEAEKKDVLLKFKEILVKNKLYL